MMTVITNKENEPKSSLSSAIDEINLRVDQIKELTEQLRAREHDPAVDGLEALVRYFVSMMTTMKPRPSYEGLMDHARYALLRAALELSGGNITVAARDIRLSRFGLQKQMKRLSAHPIGMPTPTRRNTRSHSKKSKRPKLAQVRTRKK